MKREITLTVNGRSVTATVDDADTLLEFLRDGLKLPSAGLGASVTCSGSFAGAPGPSRYRGAARAA